MMSHMKSILEDQIRAHQLENQKKNLLIRCYIINRMNILGLPVSEAIQRKPGWRDQVAPRRSRRKICNNTGKTHKC